MTYKKTTSTGLVVRSIKPCVELMKGVSIKLLHIHILINITAFQNNSDQMAFQTCSGKTKIMKSNVIIHSSEYLVIKTEILQALHIVAQHHSFVSSDNDNERFRLMLEESNIAKSYLQKETKINYSVLFGTSPYVKRNIINEIYVVPFCFKLVERVVCYGFI